MVFPCKTWVAKLDTEPEALAEGAAVFEVLANTGFPNKLIARRQLWYLLRFLIGSCELRL